MMERQQQLQDWEYAVEMSDGAGPSNAYHDLYQDADEDPLTGGWMDVKHKVPKAAAAAHGAHMLAQNDWPAPGDAAPQRSALAAHGAPAAKRATAAQPAQSGAGWIPAVHPAPRAVVPSAAVAAAMAAAAAALQPPAHVVDQHVAAPQADRRQQPIGRAHQAYDPMGGGRAAAAEPAHEAVRSQLSQMGLANRGAPGPAPGAAPGRLPNAPLFPPPAVAGAAAGPAPRQAAAGPAPAQFQAPEAQAPLAPPLNPTEDLFSCPITLVGPHMHILTASSQPCCLLNAPICMHRPVEVLRAHAFYFRLEIVLKDLHGALSLSMLVLVVVVHAYTVKSTH